MPPAATTYLDHAATTPMRPEAVEAVLPWLGGVHGNPSGSHQLARRARRAVDDARDELAELLGCRPGEVVFTSGGTESDATAVHGVLAAADGGTVAASAVEHHAVLDPVVAGGGRVVPVDAAGRIDLVALAAVLDPSVALVSVMLAGNEVGTVQPLAEVAALVAEQAPRAVLHTDAVQALPWLDVAALAAHAQLISVSGHKAGGPTGVGALVVRDRTPFAPLLLGGGQERGRRSGSHHVAGIVGMAAAARAAADDRELAGKRVRVLRDRLADGILATVPGAFETAGTAGRHERLPGSCHVCFEGVESESLLFLLDQDGVCASAASSCASGAAEPSHVLAALGIAPALARGSLRLSLGWTSTDDDVDRALATLPAAVARIRDGGR